MAEFTQQRNLMHVNKVEGGSLGVDTLKSTREVTLEKSLALANSVEKVSAEKETSIAT